MVSPRWAFCNFIASGMCMFSLLIVSIVQNNEVPEPMSLSMALLSEDFKTSSISLLISIIPLAVDIYSDHLEGLPSKRALRNWIGRTTFAVATFLTGIQFLLINKSYIPTQFNLCHYFFHVLWCYRAVINSAIMFCLCVTKPKLFTVATTTAFTFLSCLAASSTLIVVNPWPLLLAYYVRYMFLLYWSYGLYSEKTWKVVDYSCCLYLGIVTFIAFIHILSNFIDFYIDYMVNLSSANIQDIDTTPLKLAIMMYSYVITVTFVSIIPGRIARIEAVESKDKIIDTKKAFVRFISHELRTPLNTVFMGLKLSLDQIPADSGHPVDMELRGTLVEVSAACGVALETLNEFLFYDKLEDGILELHKHSVKIYDFVHSVVQMFLVQMREKSITCVFGAPPVFVSAVALESQDSDKSSSDASGKEFTADGSDITQIRPVPFDDSISIDKHKLSQVLRNLLSNAIKFTPQEGTIEISIWYRLNTVPTDTENINPNIHNNTKIATNSFSVDKKVANKIKDRHDTNNSHEGDSMDTDQDSVRGHTPPRSNLPSYTRPYKILKSSSSQKRVSPGTAVFEAATQNQVKQPQIDEKDKVTNLSKSDDSNNDATSRTSGHLIIQFRDSGAGIEVKDQKRLFKEIIQFKPEKLQNGGGSGLGLWLSNGIVELHGGKLKVYSEGEGKGSTFTLELPVSCIKVCPNTVPVKPVIFAPQSEFSSTRNSSYEIINTGDHSSRVQSRRFQSNDYGHYEIISSTRNSFELHNQGNISNKGNAIRQSGENISNKSFSSSLMGQMIVNPDREFEKPSSIKGLNINLSETDDRSFSVYSKANNSPVRSIPSSYPTSVPQNVDTYSVPNIVRDTELNLPTDTLRGSKSYDNIRLSNITREPYSIEGWVDSGRTDHTCSETVTTAAGNISGDVDFNFEATTSSRRGHLVSGKTNQSTQSSSKKTLGIPLSLNNTFSNAFTNSSNPGNISAARYHPIGIDVNSSTSRSDISNLTSIHNTMTTGRSDTSVAGAGITQHSSRSYVALSRSNTVDSQFQQQQTDSSRSDNTPDDLARYTLEAPPSRVITEYSNLRGLESFISASSKSQMSPLQRRVPSLYTEHISPHQSSLLSPKRILSPKNVFSRGTTYIRDNRDTKDITLSSKEVYIPDDPHRDNVPVTTPSARDYINAYDVCTTPLSGGFKKAYSELPSSRYYEDNDSPIRDTSSVRSAPNSPEMPIRRSYSTSYIDRDSPSKSPSHAIVQLMSQSCGEGQLIYSSSPCLLIVDDSEINRKMLCKLLQKNGYVCNEATDGQHAVELVTGKIHNASEPYDAILMDSSMPRMDGPTATAEIRKLDYTGPIIGVTGNVLPLDIEKFIAAGASTILTKPLDIDALKQALLEYKATF